MNKTVTNYFLGSSSGILTAVFKPTDTLRGKSIKPKLVGCETSALYHSKKEVFRQS